MRKEDTPSAEFAQFMDMIAPFLAYEALRDLPLQDAPIRTPLMEMQAPFVAEKNVTLVSVLGAGQGLLPRTRTNLLPWAKLAYIAVRRDEKTLEPKLSYERLPRDLSQELVLVVDPMLATGGSSSAVLSLLKKKGAKRLRLITLISAPEGVMRIKQDHGDVMVFTLALDARLNERGFISPGLGDAGDRYHGTSPA